ncbi:unnamed protein product [Sphagnum balticum]
MMAQNTSEDNEISDLDSNSDSEAVDSIPVGASNGWLKSYLDRSLKPAADKFDSRIQSENQPTNWLYRNFLRSRGRVYEETLRQARTHKDTRSLAEKEDDERIEDFFVAVIEEDFKKYAKAQPKCGRSECWAAREKFVNIVVALLRPRGADGPKSLDEGHQPIQISKGVLALAIAAENNDLKMVEALKHIAVNDESFESRDPEPDSLSRDDKLFHTDLNLFLYILYPEHQVWLCPIEAAARMGHVDMVTRLIDLHEAKIESIQQTMKEDASEDGEAMMKDELSVKVTKEKRKWIRAFYWAVSMGRDEVVKLLIERDFYIFDLNKANDVCGLLDNADVKSYGQYQSPLLLAVLRGHLEVVKVLYKAREGGVSTDAKTEKGKSVIQIAFKKSRYRAKDLFDPEYPIWKYIMERPDNRREVKRLTEERKVHVDAINAILVGTALIATATFAGWLSPPLGYSSPPGMDGLAFASVEGHPILEKFWVFNSLSFFFAIATFMVGANVALPPGEDDYIGDVVESLRWKLTLAYSLVSAAVFFVIGAFACAGFAVLPPIPKYTVNMALTVGIGVTVVAVVVFSTFFGHMFTKSGWQHVKQKMKIRWQQFGDMFSKSGWQQLKLKMKFPCWQQSKAETESSDDD